jgi:type II secretory pathway component PulF
VATFRYTGISRAGIPQKGILEADSAVLARRKLHTEGIFPLTLKEGPPERRSGFLPSLLRWAPCSR